MTRDELLTRLLHLADEQNSLLKDSSWEAASALQVEYDELFGTLEQSVSAASLDEAEIELLRVLHARHTENVELMKSLQIEAGTALAELAQIGQFLSYAPVRSGDAPRFLDESA